MSEFIPLSQLTFTPDAKPKELDTQGALVWLPLTKLGIDPRYQRPLSERGIRNIRSIIENFSWNLFSTLIVAPREDGTYAVIDGQHRAIGAYSHGGIEKVPCYVIKGNIAEQAKAFSVINGHVTAITPQQLFFARIVAGDQKALDLKVVLDTAGIIIIRGNKSPKDMKAGETIAVDAIEKAFRVFGKETLITALQTITETGDGNRGFIKARVVTATCFVLHNNPKWRESGEALFRAIETTSIAKLYDRAEKMKANQRVSFHEAYVNLLYKLLTDNLKEGK